METGRLEGFSDGVFAVAITLLVFGIAVPPAGTSLPDELRQLWPSYLAYAVSFLVIGAIWINHHAMFWHIARTDGTLLLLNLLQLMLVAFLPFPTAVMASAFSHTADETIATAFYGGTLAVLGIIVGCGVVLCGPRSSTAWFAPDVGRGEHTLGEITLANLAA